MSKTMVNEVCPACGEGSLTQRFGVDLMDYRGISSAIPTLSHLCDSCGAVLFDSADLRANKRAFVRFRKEVDMIPLGCEIEAMRRRAGLTQRDAGDFFGGGPVAFSKYESDDLVPDDAMVNLLKLAIAFPDTVDRLRAIRNSHVSIQLHSYVVDDSETEWSVLNTKYDSVAVEIGVTVVKTTKSVEKVWTLQ
jgi:HTH-type transcriptional regulator / antitoxin MqsA